jgi:hypothetical protein
MADLRDRVLDPVVLGVDHRLYALDVGLQFIVVSGV